MNGDGYANQSMVWTSATTPVRRGSKRGGLGFWT